MGGRGWGGAYGVREGVNVADIWVIDKAVPLSDLGPGVFTWRTTVKEMFDVDDGECRRGEGASVEPCLLGIVIVTSRRIVSFSVTKG